MHHFTLLITEWYRQNARNLPWRQTNDPYFIWLSEVILQQTRVDQGINYYYKFIEAFPTVHHLAKAEEQEVLKLWQGLGYYSRARNLHTAAQHVVNHFEGNFPNNFEDIKGLKGVGDYTAAAIASFAFQLPYAVVDGNVYRLLSRYFGEATPIDSSKGKKLFSALAQAFLPESDPETYNQALMEMGAIMCTPKKPNCADCPLNESCISLREGSTSELPVKSKKTKTRNRYFNYLIPENSESIILKQRAEKDIWANMFEPPLIETTEPVSSVEIESSLPPSLTGCILPQLSAEYKHILSHQHIFAKFWVIQNPQFDASTGLKWVNQDQLHLYPLPRLIDRYLEKHTLNIPK